MTRQILKTVIPYIEGDGVKVRPVVQLSNPSDEHKNLQVAYITSQEPNDNFITDIKIDLKHKDFSKTGLNKTSYIRASKIFTVSASMIESVIGDLPPDLTSQLNQILKTNLKLNN